MKTKIANSMESSLVIRVEEEEGIENIEDIEDIEEIVFNEEEEEEEEVEENGISYWEFVNGSDFSSPDDHDPSIDTLSLDSLPSWDSSLSTSPPTVVVEDVSGFRLEDHDIDPHEVVDDTCYVLNQNFDDDAADAVDDDVDDIDDDDLDDELVPWHLSGKLGRNRMRKLGKKSSSKMIHSAKRNPYRYVKPGCVHGKHGLGVKVGY